MPNLKTDVFIFFINNLSDPDPDLSDVNNAYAIINIVLPLHFELAFE